MQKRTWLRWLIIIPLILVAYVGWALLRPLPALKPVPAAASLQFSTPAPVLSWPPEPAAVGIVGTNLLGTHGPQKPAPTASTAKIITSLMVLRQKPLSVGRQGPIITLTANDVAIYNAYNSKQGSVVPVQAGEQISEYQMLQAMLLPSANNMADSLAIWAYGSLPAYQTQANAWLKQQGLANTTVGSDASGFNPSTVSTAHDLVVLGEQVMQNPVLAGIVGQSSASGIPIANNIKNVNFLLGTNSIVGVKTGNTDQAGGVFVGAARTEVNQKPVTIVTALISAPSLFQSMKDSLSLIQTSQINFQTDTPVHQNDTLGQYKVPWGDAVLAVASHNMALTTWNGTTIPGKLSLNKINVHAQAGQSVGKVAVSDPVTGFKNSVNVQLAAAPGVPTLKWRLLHPY